MYFFLIGVESFIFNVNDTLFEYFIGGKSLGKNIDNYNICIYILMNITTKGHIENINNDKVTTNSWDGRWDQAQGTGSIATINTNKQGNEPVNVVEDYKPIADVKELNPYMNNDPRMDQYFALRTIPRKATEPAQEVHDDTYTPKNSGALVDKLESLLNKEPKVIVFKPQTQVPSTPSSPSMSSMSSMSSSSMSSPSMSSSMSSSSMSKSKSRHRKHSKKHYATPKRKTTNVQTRKKKTPTTPKKQKTPTTPKKKKTPTPKKKKTFTPPTIGLTKAV